MNWSASIGRWVFGAHMFSFVVGAYYASGADRHICVQAGPFYVIRNFGEAL